MLGTVLVFMILAALTGGQLESPTPRCAISCWENTKYVSSCLGDDACLCNESDFLQSVFRCVYSQCDTVHFGLALHHSLSRCSDIGGQSIIAPIPNHDSLRRREAEYLGGGEVVESGSVFGFPTQSVGFLTQSVSVSYPTTSAEIPSFNLDTNTLFPTIPAPTSVTSTSQTSTGLESSPSSGPVLFTGGASEIELNIALPVMVTIAALYSAL